MEKNQKQFLSERAYQYIKEEIDTCLLGPGQIIVQSDLADKYGLGVTPVREALRKLALEGYVLSVPRLGYQVCQITLQDILEIYEMRIVLESAAVRLATKRASASQLQEIATLANFTYIYKKRNSYIDFLRHNAQFHLSIVAASGNQRLVYQVDRTLEELHRIFHLGLDLRDSAEEMRVDHITLSNALNNRDGDLAEAIIKTEIECSRERVLEALQKFQKSLVTPMLSQRSFDR
ncbi:MAG: GntR family transcriptional regulator [Chloroflexi bacterium HGW-Chloroflexi-10]|nr:MAG: GntR family transcriptional regulator [Chloroflexi bacterium HGW-Chloroflexi-10]